MNNLNGNGVSRSRRKDGLLTTGDMARLSKNTLRTVRFYEEAGLLQPEQRTEGGHRLFPTAELRKLQLISDLRGAGFSLEQIRDTLEAKSKQSTGADAAKDLIEKLDAQITSMQDRLELLQRLLVELKSSRAVLETCKNCTHDGFPARCAECPELPQEVPSAVGVLWQL